MLNAVNLTCENLPEPIGVYTTLPRFGWIIESDKNDVFQVAYTLQISKTPDFSDIIWQKNEESDRSVLIDYDGEAFLGHTKYYWRVKITDNYNEESPWNQSFFVTACYNMEGVFIARENAPESSGSVFKYDFSTDQEVKEAYMSVTSKGVYRVSLNSVRVGADVLSPGYTEYDDRLLTHTYDVSALLTSGGNTISAMIAPGWFTGYLGWAEKGAKNNRLYGDDNALLLTLDIVYTDGSKKRIVTNKDWLCAESPVLYSEIYHGEKYDARLEDKGVWKPVIIESADLSAVMPSEGVPVREQAIFKAVEIFTTPGGDRVIDFGQNISGYVRFSVSGKAGDKVRLRHSEVLDKDGNFYTENLRSAKQTIEYTLKGGGIETYAPYFTFQGFRYISVDEYPGELDISSFEAAAIYSDMRETGFFNCSDELVNKLVSNVKWGMRDNFVDIPTDCPQRDERLGWTGDAQAFCRAAGYLHETLPFFRKWLKDMTLSQRDDGAVPDVIPDTILKNRRLSRSVSGNAGATGWSDAAVIIPWTVYKYFGDLKILEDSYETMKRWLAYIKSNAKDGVLWNSGKHYGDWLALDAKEGSYLGATPNDLTATAFYANSADILAKTAGVLGKTEDQKEYEALHGDIVKAFQDEFFTKTGRLAVPTQTAHVLALQFSLTPPEFTERTIKTLTDMIKDNKIHITTGFLGTPYIAHVLSANGNTSLAYDLLLQREYPSWLYPITKGATTIWEHWDGIKPDGSMWSADMNSFNHYAYGAIADWLFSVAGGIDPVKPGYKEISIAPKLSRKLTGAETRVLSPYGEIYTKWSINNAEAELIVKIPHNTRAYITLPGVSEGEYGGIGFKSSPAGAEAALGSGNYTFKFPCSV